MEAYFGEVVLRHLENVAGVCKEHVTPFAVSGHELVFALFERGQSLGIVTLYPTSLV